MTKQVDHLDQQQCPWLGPHTHDVCGCDPDAEPPTEDYDYKRDGLPEWNTRAHIKQVLDGHWPLTEAQTIVICDRCRGAIEKTPSHQSALNYQPLTA